MRIGDLSEAAGELEQLLDLTRVEERLGGVGTKGAQAGSAANSLVACARTLRDAGPPAGSPAYGFWVPGRIEVLGKHTDYLGGRSLLAAAELGIAGVAIPRADDCVRITDVRCGAKVEFRISADLQPEAGSWRNYPMTVARRLARDCPGPLRGADLALSSNLPAAAGMSSSSALITGVLLVLIAVNRLQRTAPFRESIRTEEDLADYAAAVESGADFGPLAGDSGVGTHGGSEDHTAILCARAGHLAQYAFAPARCERVVAVPLGYTFVIASSGVRAEKTGPVMLRYNRVAELGREVLNVWRHGTGRKDTSLAVALASDPRAAHHLRDLLDSSRVSDCKPQELIARLEQFRMESLEIIPAAAEALARGDLGCFGALVERSQDLAERLLHNQVPETMDLVRLARGLGAVAASAFGAGFGGSVWALVAEDEAESFRARWHLRYRERFPARTDAAFLVTRAGPPAQRVI